VHSLGAEKESARDITCDTLARQQLLSSGKKKKGARVRPKDPEALYVKMGNTQEKRKRNPETRKFPRLKEKGKGTWGGFAHYSVMKQLGL